MRIFLLLSILFISFPTLAHEEMKKMDMEHSASTNTLKLEMISPALLEVGREAKLTLKLSEAVNNKPVPFEKLKEAHTKRFHLLVIDETLTDYHHVHPVPDKKTGEYSFSFVPNKKGNYRIWADVIPIATGKEEYIIADLKGKEAAKGNIEKKSSNKVIVDGLTFELLFDTELKAGSQAMGKVKITKGKKPVTNLQPIMGAFAHIVAFNEDRESIVHIHPMGKEPESASDRGGPELDFHIEPKKAGFNKLFVQVNVNGKEVFAPFGVVIK